jgi:hypothetical protein
MKKNKKEPIQKYRKKQRRIKELLKNRNAETEQCVNRSTEKRVFDQYVQNLH